MLPQLFKIGPVPINSYGLMIAIGFLVGLFLVLRTARKWGMNDKVLADAAFFVLPIGILGCRLLHIILFPSAYSWDDPLGWIAVWRGGLVFQGGPPAGILFLWWYLPRHGVSFWRTVDAATPFLPLAHGFGRLGCFLNGCCYGKPSDAPWAIAFPRIPRDTSLPVMGSRVYEDHLRRFSDLSPDVHLWSHPVHPTQLYEFAGLMALCGFLLLLRKKWYPYVGFQLPIYLIGYGVLRFIVEMYRGDHNPTHFLGLTDQQFFSVVFAILGVVLYFVLRRRPGAYPVPVVAAEFVANAGETVLDVW